MILNAFYDSLGLEQVVGAGYFGDVKVHHMVEKFMVAEPPVQAGALVSRHMKGNGVLFQIVGQENHGPML